MKTFSYISKSIGLMQATLLLVSALLIGLGLSAWQMRAALGDQRGAVVEHAERLLDLSLSGAASAAWAIDADLAREIADGIIRQEGVVAVEIHADLRQDASQLLARVEKDTAPAGGGEGRRARVAPGPVRRGSRDRPMRTTRPRPDSPA